MMNLLLPLIAFVVGAPRVTPTPATPAAPAASEKMAQTDKISATARAAQVRLARVLADADAIESIAAVGRDVTFTIVEAGEPLHVVAHTTRRGTVTTFVVVPADDGDPPAALGEGALSWLADELASTRAVTRLVADEDGGVIITMDDHRRYVVLPGRGSGGADVGARARWAGTWSGSGDES